MRPLENIRVVDASDSVAGAYCAKLLLDQGAQVSILEPKDGSTLRSALPAGPDGTSFLWTHLNAGKDVADKADLAGADIVLAGLGDVPKLGGAAVLCRFSDFGADGPKADWIGTEMVHQALSGIMYQNGQPDKRPLYGCGERASYAAGLFAYISVLAALWSGKGEEIEIETGLVAASMSYNLPNQYFYSGTYADRSVVPGTPMGIAKCSDGYLCYFIYAHRWTAACDALDMPHLAQDPDYATAEGRATHWSTITAKIDKVTATMTMDELEARFIDLGVPVARSYTPDALLASDHLSARGWWHETPNGDPVLGPPFLLSGFDWGRPDIRKRAS